MASEHTEKLSVGAKDRFEAITEREERQENAHTVASDFLQLMEVYREVVMKRPHQSNQAAAMAIIDFLYDFEMGAGPGIKEQSAVRQKILEACCLWFFTRGIHDFKQRDEMVKLWEDIAAILLLFQSQSLRIALPALTKEFHIGDGKSPMETNKAMIQAAAETNERHARRSRAIALLDGVPTEAKMTGACRKLWRKGEEVLKEAYLDVVAYTQYLESLPQMEPHQKVRALRANWFFPIAAQIMVNKGYEL